VPSVQQKAGRLWVHVTNVGETIPKACGFEAATRFQSILLGGSLIPIAVIGMGMALSILYLQR
jgi:hypothetical protein